MPISKPNYSLKNTIFVYKVDGHHISVEFTTEKNPPEDREIFQVYDFSLERTTFSKMLLFGVICFEYFMVVIAILLAVSVVTLFNNFIQFES